MVGELQPSAPTTVFNISG